MPKTGAGKKRWTNANSSASRTSRNVAAPSKACTSGSPHTDTASFASQRAAQEESDLTRALELSQADAQNKKEADAELDRALQASFAASREEEDLQQTLDISKTLADSSGLPSTAPGASEPPSAASAGPCANCEDCSPVGHFMLKACRDGDTRRSRVEWPRGASFSAVLEQIRKTVRRIFSTSLDGLEFALKYYDGDGDACTLVEATLEDAFSFVYNGTLYLLVDVVQAPSSELQMDAGVGSLPSRREAEELESGAFQIVSSEDGRVPAISIATPPSTPREALGSSCVSDCGDTLDWTMVCLDDAEMRTVA